MILCSQALVFFGALGGAWACAHVRVLRLRSRSALGPALVVQGLLPAGAAFAAGNFDGTIAVPAIAGAEYELARARALPGR